MVASIWALCSVCVHLHLVPCTSTVQIHGKLDDLFLPVSLQTPCMKVVPKFCYWCKINSLARSSVSFMEWPPHWSRFLDMLTFPAVASRALCSRYSCTRRCTVRALKFSEANRFFQFLLSLTFSPTFRLGGPTAFLGVCIPATLRATRGTRGGFLGDLLGIALALDSVVLAMAKSF